MHLSILSRSLTVPTTRRLAEAAVALGHRAVVVEPMSVQMSVGLNGPGLFRERRAVAKTDVVIPRFAQSINAYGLAVLGQFESMGTPSLNSSAAVAQSRNKMRLMQALCAQGVRVPPTVMGRGAKLLRSMVERVGGFPVIIRLVQSSGRHGVIVCESQQSMEAAMEAVLSMGHNVILQPYVRPSEGRDLRALVVAGEVLAAVARRPLAGKLRHSLSSGAKLRRVTLGAEYQELAVAAARVAGLEVAAVDLLDLKGVGPKVYEIHASPGLRDLESVCRLDLATPVVSRAIELAREGRKSRAGKRG